MIDKYGEGLYPDLLFYFGVNLVDAVRGDMAPLFVLSLVERLPEGSKTFSLMQDLEHWRAYMDVDGHYYALAAIVNAVNCNTGARGNFKKKPKFDPFPVPESIVKTARKKKDANRLENLHRHMMRGIK